MVEKKSERRAGVRFVDATNSTDGFTVSIENGTVRYALLLKNPKTNQGVSFETTFNDGYFRDLKQAATLFTDFCKNNLDENVFDSNESTLNKAFINYISENYKSNFVMDESFAQKINGFTLPKGKQPEDKKTEKNEDRQQQRQSQIGIETIAFGTSEGWTSDPEKYKNLTMPLYRKNNDGVRLEIHKVMDEHNEPQLMYCFIVHPHNDNFFINDANGREGGVFGFGVVLKNCCFINHQQLFKLLSNFYKENILGKYLEVFDNELQYKNKKLCDTNIRQELQDYIVQGIKDGRLDKIQRIQINPEFIHSSRVLTSKLEIATPESYMSKLHDPNVRDLVFIPQNNHPLQNAGNNMINTIPLSQEER